MEEDDKSKDAESKAPDQEISEEYGEEDKKVLVDYIREASDRLSLKAQLRSANQEISELVDEEIGRLDSSLKKNTAFIKKLRNTTESQKEVLMKECSTLNLTKYMAEVTSALIEAKLKMADVPAVIEISSLIHQRFPDFSATYLECWQKILRSKKEDKAPNASKLRVDLRLFADLVAVEIFTMKEGLSILSEQLRFFASAEQDLQANLPIMLSFCKHCGDDYAGLIPRRIKKLSAHFGLDVPSSNFLAPERQAACRRLLSEYFSSLCKLLKNTHKHLVQQEHTNLKIIQTRGELSADRKANLEQAQISFQKLSANAASFADLLDADLPDLPREEMRFDADNFGINIFLPSSEEFPLEGSLFEDEDTRMFYENLPDLRAYVPSMLYKESITAIADATKEEDSEKEISEELKVEDVEAELEEEKFKEEDIIEEPPAIAATEDEEFDIGTSMKLMLEAFLQNLPKCVNRDLIDKAAIDFCTNMNTKLNRRKLTKALFTVHRTRYDLLPFYARLVAILNPCMPDIATDLNASLKQDLKYHIRKKDQINIESKLKTVRFIGEMIKFRLLSRNECLNYLKLLLAEFSHHNIDMCCALLEACGRFLYRNADSFHRTKVYLDVMMRKKTALHLDSRYETMIENAYCYCLPSVGRQENIIERPPLHQFIRKCLYKDLSKTSTERILKLMRRLDWDDEEVRNYAARCLTKIWNVRYSSIHCMASLLAGLAPYHETLPVVVVDAVLEDIRFGMEVNHPKFNQRRISMCKYLGELYNYRLVESNVIFKTLYSFISFGVLLEDMIASLLDPPEHLFRINMVCTLLDTCGIYFDRGSSRRKLETFLVYFQRYYWLKRSSPFWTESSPFPMMVAYQVLETLEVLKPNLKICKDLQAALDDAERLDSKYQAKLRELLPNDEKLLGGICEVADTTSGEEEMLEDDESSQDSDLEESETGERLRSNQNDETQETNEGSSEWTDEVSMKSGPRTINCEEDNDFMVALDSMMADTLRTTDTVKAPPLDIALPMNYKSGFKNRSVTAPDSADGNQDISFVLLTKKGNKQQFISLDVPISNEVVSKLRAQEEAERQEKENMKRMVLALNERQEEEENQELLSAVNRPLTYGIRREKKVRYNHLKGTPDVDAIFGQRMMKR